MVSRAPDISSAVSGALDVESRAEICGCPHDTVPVHGIGPAVAKSCDEFDTAIMSAVADIKRLMQGEDSVDESGSRTLLYWLFLAARFFWSFALNPSWVLTDSVAVAASQESH